MANIIIACSKKPLAAFIETALAVFDIDCRIVDDVSLLLALLDESKTNVLLFDVTFPSPGESLELLGELRSRNPKLSIVGIVEPFAENLDQVRQIFTAGTILTLPFSGDDLRERLKQVSGLDLTEKIVDQQREEDENMSESQDVPVTIFELTEIVEEGLPLDEIPGLDDSQVPEPLSEMAAASSAESIPTDSPAVLSGDLELDDFSDDLEDFGSAFESVSAASAEVKPDTEKISVNGPNLDNETLVEEPLAVAAEAIDVIESPLAEDSTGFIAGDVDALLADDEFTEVEIPEPPDNDDPVLAELKSAGLTAEDDLSDNVDLLQESSNGEDSVAESPLEPEFKIAGNDDGLVEEVAGEDLFPGGSEGQEKGFSGDVIDTELPEDYLLEEDMPDFSGESELESEAESESQLLTSPSSVESEEPEICPEPISLDFSRQIENMTQEWSKQLLQSTYASMDKMIKAIGDMAPTIVDQVAREVIPPLAEKVIKAEIARLEKTLEIEEEQEEETSD